MTMANFDLSMLALKSVCPNNTIEVDDTDLPSVLVHVERVLFSLYGGFLVHAVAVLGCVLSRRSLLVYIPAFKNSDVLTGGNDSTHPAFIVKSVDFGIAL